MTLLRQEIAKCEAEIRKFNEAVRANPAALAASSAAIAREAADLQRLQRELRQTQIASTNFGNAGLQASYAIQDFADASGGLTEKLRGVSNNLPLIIQGLGGPAGLAAGIMLAVVAVKSLYENWDSLLRLFGDTRPKTAAQEIEELGKKTHLTANETERLARAEKLRREQERAHAKAVELSDAVPEAQKKTAAEVGKAITDLGVLPNGKPGRSGFDMMTEAASKLGGNNGIFGDFLDVDDKKAIEDAKKSFEDFMDGRPENILNPDIVKGFKKRIEDATNAAWQNAVYGKRDKNGDRAGNLRNDANGMSIQDFMANPAALGKGVPDLFRLVQMPAFRDQLTKILGGGKEGQQRLDDFLGRLAQAAPHDMQRKLDDEAARKLRKRIEDVQKAIAENLPLLKKEEIDKAQEEIDEANKALGSKNLDKMRKALESLDIFGDEFKDRLDELKDKKTLREKLIDQITSLEKWLDDNVDVLSEDELNSLRTVIMSARDKLGKQTEEAYREALNWLQDVFDKEFRRKIEKQTGDRKDEERLKDEAATEGNRQSAERKKKAEELMKEDPLMGEKALADMDRRARDLAKVDPEERKRRIKERGRELEVEHRGKIGGELGTLTGRRLATPEVDAQLAAEAPGRLRMAKEKAREEEIARLQKQIVDENRAAGNNIRESEAKKLAEEKLRDFENDRNKKAMRDAMSGKSLRDANPAADDQLQMQFMKGLMGGMHPDQVRRAMTEGLAQELQRVTPGLGKDGAAVAAENILKDVQTDVLKGLYQGQDKGRGIELFQGHENKANRIIDGADQVGRQQLDVLKQMLDVLRRNRPDLLRWPN